ncbi:MAG TPA: potassium transporter TrkG [Armatimonadota bacterium]
MQLLALTFLILIILGTVLLSLPVARQPGHPVDLLNCLFTATSATTLTGLVTVSTADTWTLFGKIVLLALIQLGGLCYMVAGTIIALLLGLRLGLRDRLKLPDMHGKFGQSEALRVTWYALSLTLIIECLGALCFSTHWLLHHHAATLRDAAFSGIFYAISAFCNAGFELAPGFAGLAHPALRHDTFVLIVIGVLASLGGLGLGVITELAALPRTRRLNLHSKIVLTTTLAIFILGMLLLTLFEANNVQSLASMDNPASRLLTTGFLSVSARSAGFSPVDVTTLSPPSLLLLSALIFIGGAAGGMTGGVKVSTISVILLAILALLRQRPDIEVFRRRISGEMVRLALSLVCLALLALALLIIGISVTEITLKGLAPTADTMTRYVHLVFEVVSAFGNAGMRTGVTPTLEPLSRVLLIIAMLLGRLGPLVFVYIFAQPKRPLLRRLPVEAVMAG